MHETWREQDAELSDALPGSFVALVLVLAMIMLGAFLADWRGKLLAIVYFGLLVEFVVTRCWTSRKGWSARTRIRHEPTSSR